ncbi:MAG: hypothetical protein V2A62_02865 [Candidatus Woesearchaeota archaeon]
MIKVEKEGGSLFYSLDWRESVDKPAKEENYKEAFASADSWIDSEIESLLRYMYGENKCQDLINEIHYLRSRVNFDGMMILEILKSKTVVDEEFVNKIREFKKARNLVLHSTRGIYELVRLSEMKDIKDEEFETEAKERANHWLKIAHEIYIKLGIKFSEIDKRGKEYYTSDLFYQKNPRLKIFERQHPKYKTQNK